MMHQKSRALLHGPHFTVKTGSVFWGRKAEEDIPTGFVFQRFHKCLADILNDNRLLGATLDLREIILNSTAALPRCSLAHFLNFLQLTHTYPLPNTHIASLQSLAVSQPLHCNAKAGFNFHAISCRLQLKLLGHNHIGRSFFPPRLNVRRSRKRRL